MLYLSHAPLEVILLIFNFYTILFLFWETKVKRIK